MNSASGEIVSRASGDRLGSSMEKFTNLNVHADSISAATRLWALFDQNGDSYTLVTHTVALFSRYRRGTISLMS